MPLQNRSRSLEPNTAVTLRFEVLSSMHSVLPFFRLIARSLQEQYVAIKIISSFRLDSISSIDINDKYSTVSSRNCTTLL